MSLLTLIDRRTRIGPIAIDITDSETHGVEVDVTSQVVEGLTQTADHALLRPREVSFQGRIVWIAGIRLIHVPGHAARVHKALVLAARTRLPLTVQTRLETYANMMIVSYRGTMSNDSSTLDVALTLRNVAFVLGTVPALPAPAAEDLAGSEDYLGQLGGTVQ